MADSSLCDRYDDVIVARFAGTEDTHGKSCTKQV